MFTHAGLNLRGRAILRAQVYKLGSSRSAYATLYRFASGDLAWVSRTQVCWPHQVRCVGEFWAGPGVKRWPPGQRISCRLEERPQTVT